MASVVTNAAKSIVTNRIKGSGTEPKYIGWGTGAGTAAVGDTTLFTEALSTSNDGSHRTRVTGTSSIVTTTVTNDTYQVTGVVTANGSITITNAGLFDSLGTSADMSTAPSGGNLYCKSDFTGVVMIAADTITFTFSVQY